MFLEKNLSKAGQKKSIGIKPCYSNTFYGFEYKKNSISKLSIKMFIKRKTTAEKAYAYRVLLSFKTSVTYIFFKLRAGQLCPL